jgi:hypothetical protein
VISWKVIGRETCVSGLVQLFGEPVTALCPTIVGSDKQDGAILQGCLSPNLQEYSRFAWLILDSVIA